MGDSPARGLRPAPAHRAEERRLLTAWLVHGRGDAREQLYLTHRPLACRIARRYQFAAGETLDDLVQVAGIGLLKAIDRFDLARTTSLTAYAARMIDGELRHHLRDSSALVHVPRALYAKSHAVAGAAAHLAARLGRGPTPAEIATELDLEREEVVEALEAGTALRPQSLDPPAQPLHAAIRLGEEDPHYELVERRVAIDRTWRSMDPRERVCLRLRFEQDLTYAEVAERVGLSVTHTARLTARALARLQAVAEAAEP